MKRMKRWLSIALCACMVLGLAGCASSATGGTSGRKRIVRISRAQSETHPEHLGLLAFKEYVEENLGDKYEVQIFPNEIIIDLCTGNIDLVEAEESYGNDETK